MSLLSDNLVGKQTYSFTWWFVVLWLLNSVSFIAWKMILGVLFRSLLTYKFISYTEVALYRLK